MIKILIFIVNISVKKHFYLLLYMTSVFIEKVRILLICNMYYFTLL